MKYTLFLLSLLILNGTFAQYPCGYYKFKEQYNRQGMKDKDGNVVIEPVYVFIFNSKELIFAENQDQKYGAMDCDGSVVVPFEYDDMDGMDRDVIRVKKGEKYGLIDSKGNTVAELKYDAIYSSTSWEKSATPFYYNDIAITYLDGKYGFIHKSGKIIHEPVFSIVDRFVSSSMFVNKDGKWGLIGKDAKMITDFIYEDRYTHYDIKEAAIAKKDGYWALVKYNGQALTPFKYDNINLKEYNNGPMVVERGNKNGVIDKTGREIIVPFYDEMTPFRHSLSRTRLNGRYGYVHITGKVILPPEYTELEDVSNSYSDGWSGQIVINGKYGHADPETGRITIPCEYDELHYSIDGFCLAKKDDKWGYLNPEGKIIIPFLYEDIRYFENGIALVQKAGKWGCINKSGKEITPCIYDGQSGNYNGYISVSKNGKWGFINPQGKEFVPCKYDEIENFGFRDWHKGFAMVKLNNKWMFVNKKGETDVIPPACSKLPVEENIKKGNYSEGLAMVYRCEYKCKAYTDEYINCHYAFVDEDNNVVFDLPPDIKSGTKPKFEFSEGLALIHYRPEDSGIDWEWKRNYGYINREGKIVIPCRYFAAGKFSEGLAYASDMRDDSTGIIYNTGYIDKTGNYAFILPDRYCDDNYSGCYYHGEEFQNGIATMYFAERGADCNRSGLLKVNKSGEIIEGERFHVSGWIGYCSNKMPDTEIYGREIKLYIEDDDYGWDIPVGDDGTFLLEYLPEGNHTIKYKSIFYHDEQVELNVKDEDIKNLNICTDKLNDSIELLITKLKDNEQYTIYCETNKDENFEQIIIENKKGKLLASFYYNDKKAGKTKIKDEQIKLLENFEKQILVISNMRFGGKHNNPLSIHIESDNGEINATDYTGKFEGFKILKEQLFKITD